MKRIIFFNLILVFALIACNKAETESVGQGHDHSSEDIKLYITEYTDQLELFAESDPFVKGNTSEILAHFTTISDFKALAKASVTASLIIGKDGIRQTISEPVNTGIYKFALQPLKSGVGQLIFDIQTESYNYKIATDVHVYADAHTAEHIAEKKKSANVNAISFTKEQSWKIDFATVLPRKEQFGKVIKTTAQILPSQNSETIISARTNGVVKINDHLLEGQELTSGETLFTISGKGLANDNLEVRFQEAKNNFEAAKADYERKEALSEKQIVSIKELETSKVNYENTKAIYDNLRNNFNAKGQIVTAPGGGIVKHIFIKNGEYVDAGDPLFSFSNDDKLVVKAEIQQKNYSQLKSISSFSIKSYINDKFYTQDDLNGKLLSYGKSIDEIESYLVPVNFEIDNNQGLIKGSFVDIYIKTKSKDDVLIVPNSSLVEEYGNFFLFVQLTPELFEKREVKVGASDGINSEIISGLTEKERIVSQGAIIVKLAAVSNSLDPHAGHVH